MKNKLISFFLVLLILAALPLSAAAKEFDPNEKGSISLTLVSKGENGAMAGAEFSVYYVATVALSQDGDLVYAYTEDFADCGIPLDAPDLAQKLDGFVSRRPMDCRTVVTDSQGKATCWDLPLGVYLVKQTGNAAGFAPCPTFLVTVPMETQKGYQYHVDASPKTDVERLINITIKKVWNTDKSTAIPGSVTVHLMHYDQVVDTATLNEKNHWQVTYFNVPESDGYHIKEDVPKGFTATYSRKGYEFTVTNTATLAQTGQLIWPIPVLAAAGLFFLLVGFAILRKSEEDHA